MNLLVITSLYPGYVGEPKSDIPYAVHYFCKEWSKNNNVKVITTRTVYPKIFKKNPYIKSKYKDHSYSKFKLDNIEIYKIPSIIYPKLRTNSRLNVKKNLILIENYLKEIDFIPDVIVTHMIESSFLLACEVKRKYKIPLIMTIHNGDINLSSNYYVEKQFLKFEQYIDKYGFRSPVIKKLFLDKYKDRVNRKDISIIYSGVEKNNIISLEKLKLKSKKTSSKIIVVGSLIKRKNIDKVIIAFSKIYSRYKIELTIIGSGPEEKYLQELIKEKKLINKVKLYKEKDREEVLELMEEHDIFIMVSENETLGLVYLEAMAKGNIVIGTKGEGIDGIIVNEFNGFLSEKNIASIEKNLEKALNLNYQQKSMILSQAYQTIVKLSQEEASKRYLEYIIDSLV